MEHLCSTLKPPQKHGPWQISTSSTHLFGNPLTILLIDSPMPLCWEPLLWNGQRSCGEWGEVMIHKMGKENNGESEDHITGKLDDLHVLFNLLGGCFGLDWVFVLLELGTEEVHMRWKSFRNNLKVLMLQQLGQGSCLSAGTGVKVIRVLNVLRTLKEILCCPTLLMDQMWNFHLTLDGSLWTTILSRTKNICKCGCSGDQSWIRVPAFKGCREQFRAAALTSTGYCQWTLSRSKSKPTVSVVRLKLSPYCLSLGPKVTRGVWRHHGKMWKHSTTMRASFIF